MGVHRSHEFRHKVRPGLFLPSPPFQSAFGKRKGEKLFSLVECFWGSRKDLSIYRVLSQYFLVIFYFIFYFLFFLICAHSLWLKAGTHSILASPQLLISVGSANSTKTNTHTHTHNFFFFFRDREK